MAKQIKFEGKIHSFPDNATEDEINIALGSSVNKKSLFEKISTELSGAYHMPLGRSLKNVGQGAIDFAEFAANPAGPAMKYMASKEIPYASRIAKHWPQFPESDVFGLGERKAGDEIFQAATPTRLAGGAVELGAKGLRKLADMALSEAPKIAEKAADKFPILKSMTQKPYKKQIKELTEKDLLTGYKPNIKDILEAQRILISPGMQIVHEAVNSAVAKALNGDFKPWHRLQSSVRSEGQRLSKKGGVHTELGDDLYNMAERMHTEQEVQQTSRGAPGAAENQRRGKARTAKYHKISPVAKVATGLAASSILPGWAARLAKSVK